MPLVLDGKTVNQQILDELKPRVEQLAATRRAPGLTVVLVGNDPASEIYVRGKVKTCSDLGMISREIKMPETIQTADLLTEIEKLNADPTVDGILVQMPLPKQVDSRLVLAAIDPAKDVDGFHPYNVGNLVANLPGPRPCTPAGVMEILKRFNIPVAGKNAVVVGRSDIVGKPMALMLLHANATVTICHSRTSNLPEVCRQADILVAAIGKAGFVTKDFIREGAVVIDVGINRITDRAEAERLTHNNPQRMAAFDRRGNIVVGDVHPVDMVERASAYTPVPGGVGLLTIAMLMANTVESAELRLR